MANNFVAINRKKSSFFICGYIIDKETGAPLEAATVTSKNDYTTTDPFGYFKIKVNQDNEVITIRHLGFIPITKSASLFENDECSNIFITPQIEMLSGILLRNYITQGISKVADGTLNINFSNFGILPGLIETDVLQTVQALPGIQSTDETVSNINIRGGNNDENLILWDGIKMYQSGHFFGLISIFNPLITSDVTVVKNGSDVDLSDGVSGTIAMKTETNINSTLAGNFGTNFINGDGFIDLPLGEKSSLQLSARKSISDLVETPTYSNYFDRILQETEVVETGTSVVNSDIKFDFYDTSLRWLYNISDKDKLRFNFLLVNNELVFNESANIDTTIESKESSLVQRSIAEGIFYERNWNDRFTTALLVYETDYKLRAINSDIIQEQVAEQENNVSETSVKLNTWYKYNDQLSFLNGYQFTETGITNITNRTDLDVPAIIQLNREVIREHAAYSQVNYSSNSKNTNVKAGARYTYLEQFKKYIIEPRLHVNHKVSDDITVELSGEFKHQNSSQIINSQNEFLGIEKRRWQLSDNIEVPLIKSKQASVGFNYNNKGWLINADVYYKEVDGITSLSQGFLNKYESEKVNGSYQVKGIDVLINKRLKNISSWLSYTFGDNEYTFNDLVDINFPNNIDITHSVSLGSSYSKNNIKVAAGLNWHSGKPTTLPLAGNEIVDNKINYASENSSRLIEYLRVDASATYTFKLSEKVKANTGVSIWNGLNYRNIVSSYYTIEDARASKIEKEALSFTPNFTFRVLF